MCRSSSLGESQALYMEVVEMFDAPTLRFCIDNFDSLELRPETKKATSEYDALAMMKRYLKASVDGCVSNRFTQKYPDIGRFRPVNGLSLGLLPREIRASIAHKIYYDLDIVNAQPVLCLQFARAKGYKCDALAHYVENREKLLKTIKYCNTRDEQKTAVLCLFYGGTLRVTAAPKWMKELYEELKEIQKQVFDDPPDPRIREIALKNQEAKREESGYYNPEGSALSLVLQTMEAACLQVMVDYCSKHQIGVYVPVFDGIMIPKENVEDLTKFMRGMENAILQRQGLVVQIIEKEMKPLPDLGVKRERRTYKVVKTEFERNHFKIKYPFCFAYEAGDDLYMQSNKKTEDSYANLYYETFDPVKMKWGRSPFILSWMADENMRTYQHMDFYAPPHVCPEGVYNLYRGLRAEKLPTNFPKVDVPVPHSDQLFQGAEGLDLILNHTDRLAGGGKEEFWYMIKWYAHRVQRPGEVPMVAMIWRSEQGTGKNLYLDFFGHKVLGSRLYYCTHDIKMLLGNFAPGIRNRVLVVLDETNGKDTFEMEDKLKSAITAEYTQFERKGVDAVTIRNSAGFIFPTNNLVPAKIGITDRRFTLFNVKNDRRNDRSYFDPLRKAMNDDNVARSFYDFLMSIDLTNFNIVGERPLNESYRELQEISIPPEARFMYDFVSTFEDHEDKRIVVSSELCTFYRNWCETNKVKCEKSNNSLGTYLGRWIGSPENKSQWTKRNKVEGRTVVSYHIDKHTVNQIFQEKGIFQYEFDD